jgi:hypothetical protein
MLLLFRSRATFVWAGLIVATLLSFELFLVPMPSSLDRRFIGVGVIVIAVLKARFIGLEFMELRHAPTALRVAFEIWLLLIGAVLIVLYRTQG